MLSRNVAIVLMAALVESILIPPGEIARTPGGLRRAAVSVTGRFYNGTIAGASLAADMQNYVLQDRYAESL